MAKSECGNIVLMVNYKDDERAYILAKQLSALPVIDRVIIVNNNAESSFSVQNKDSAIIVLEADNKGGYSYGNNVGLSFIKSHFVCKTIIIMNTDCLISSDTFLCSLDLFESQYFFTSLSIQMLDVTGNIEKNYWNFVSYSNCIKECFYLLNSKRKENKIAQVIYEKGFKIKEEDVLRGTFLLCDYQALASVGFFDNYSFLYWEEDKLFKKMTEKGFHAGVIMGLFFTHNHIYPNKKLSIKQRMLSYNRYYSSMYDYASRYLKITRFQKLFLKMCIHICKLEKLIFSIIKRVI